MPATLLNKDDFSMNFANIFRTPFSKAVSRKYSVKKLFLKFLQYSKEKIGVRVSLFYSTSVCLQKQSPRGVLKNFAKFTGKHLCQSLFFNKVAGLRPATLLEKRLAQVFSCEFCEISKNGFFIE